jgi:lipid-binding SYLF domain-containing protein
VVIPGKRSFLLAGAVFAAAVLLGSCASGPRGTADEKRAYFRKLEDESLARLVKEQPATEQDLAKSVGYAVFEQKIVKIPMFGASRGAGVLVEKAKDRRIYMRLRELQLGAGWGARAQSVILIFDDPAKLSDLADGKWRAGYSAEAAAASGNVGGSGSAGSGTAGNKGFKSYVLAEAGASASVTVNVLRIKPYSID